MALLGTLSNLETQERLRRLLRKLERVSATDGPTSPKRPKPRPERGPVLSAVIHVLRDADTPMQVRAVHAEVEALRGVPVPRPSVKDCLASNAGIGERFIRLSRGRYRLGYLASRSAASGRRLGCCSSSVGGSTEDASTSRLQSASVQSERCQFDAVSRSAGTTMSFLPAIGISR